MQMRKIYEPSKGYNFSEINGRTEAICYRKNWIDIDDEEGLDPNDDNFGTEMLNEYLWNLKTEKL